MEHGIWGDYNNSICQVRLFFRIEYFMKRDWTDRRTCVKDRADEKCKMHRYYIIFFIFRNGAVKFEKTDQKSKLDDLLCRRADGLKGKLSEPELVMTMRSI